MKIIGCQMDDVHRDVPRAVSAVEACLAEAEGQDADLVCFPECFLQGYDVTEQHVRDEALDVNSREFAGVLKRLRTFEPVIVLGMIESDRGVFFHSAVVVQRGELVARYRKTHLLPGERLIFQPGDDYPVFEVAGMTPSTTACSRQRPVES